MADPIWRVDFNFIKDFYETWYLGLFGFADYESEIFFWATFSITRNNDVDVVAFCSHWGALLKVSPLASHFSGDFCCESPCLSQYREFFAVSSLASLNIGTLITCILHVSRYSWWTDWHLQILYEIDFQTYLRVYMVLLIIRFLVFINNSQVSSSTSSL